MKIAKKIISLLAAMMLCLSVVNGVFAEKIVEPFVDVHDSALADEYKALFQYKESTKEGFTKKVPYRLYVPEDYDSNIAYPVILFLHGAGESGGDNEKQLDVGMMNQFFSNGYYKDFPCIIVAAQVPEEPQNAIGEWVNTGWKSGSYEIKDMETTGPTFTEEIQLAKNAVDQTIAEYNVDTNRIYVTGISMGGYGTWNIITHYSDFFAAAIPICGAGDPSKAEYLMNMPIWCFHGDQDTAVPVSGSRDMYEAISVYDNNKIKYTEWTDGGHAWAPAYARKDVWEWLFSQSRQTVDITELTQQLETLKGKDTAILTEEQLEKYNYAIAYSNMIVEGKIYTPANVEKATSLVAEALTFFPEPVKFNMLFVIIPVAAVAVIAVAVVLVFVLKKKKA